VTYFHVLVEGRADEPVVQEILHRRFGLMAEADFRVHPHRGKGRLPAYPNNRPEPQRQGLLDLLPAKLRAWADLPEGHVVVVLVDADNDRGVDLKAQLLAMYQALAKKPKNVLFRMAVEESESWLIADCHAVKMAYPKAKLQKITSFAPDAIVGAWERLAEALGRKPADCNGADKHEWATAIMPHVNLEHPISPSLRVFVDGIARYIAGAPALTLAS
jgi:hypothetical protein